MIWQFVVIVLSIQKYQVARTEKSGRRKVKVDSKTRKRESKEKNYPTKYQIWFFGKITLRLFCEKEETSLLEP